MLIWSKHKLKDAENTRSNMDVGAVVCLNVGVRKLRRREFCVWLATHCSGYLVAGVVLAKNVAVSATRQW